MILFLLVLTMLLVIGSVLAMSEASISRMSRVRAIALREEGRRNAPVLERIEQEPHRYLNAIYLAVMFVQNGSAILAAFVAERYLGGIWISIIAFLFTLLYFVLVEAMSKTYAILHSANVALGVAPLVWVLARALSLPTRVLIGIANVLLPGKGLKEGPFVTEEEIRSMADVGHEEGAIEEREREMIHSIFELGDTVVREVMVPRPDMVVVEAHRSIREAMRLSMKHGYSRIPVYDSDPDEIVGIVYAKDLFRATSRNGNGKQRKTVKDLMREPYFVPDAKKVSDLLREMQRTKVHMAIVVDEYGDVAGLVTLEDVLEEIVGEIADEYDVEEPDFVPLGEDTWRVKARMTIGEINDLLDVDLPDEEWDTVGGLVAAVLGKVPVEGEEAVFAGFKFEAERVQGRRIDTVVIKRSEGDSHSAAR